MKVSGLSHEKLDRCSVLTDLNLQEKENGKK